MVNFNIDAYYDDEDVLLGASIVVHDENGVVDSIDVCDSTELNTLRNSLQSLLSNYINKGSLNEQNIQTILENTNSNITINAKTLQGKSAGDFSLINHTHTGTYAPLAHSTNLDNNPYGKGDTTNYGHVKIIDNLNESSYSSGKVLSAYQGKIIKNRLEELEKKPILTVGRYNMSTGEFEGMGWSGIQVTRGVHGIGIKIKGLSDSFNPTTLTVQCTINGVVYSSETTSTLQFNQNGEAYIAVNGVDIPSGFVLVKVLPTTNFEGVESIVYMI